MKKGIIACLLAVLLTLSACSGGTKIPDVDLTQVRTDLLEAQGIEDPYLLDTDALKSLYGIEAEDVAQSASYVTMDGTFPDEIILVQAVDDKAAERIQSCLKTRLDEVMVQSQTYDPENYAAAQKCTVTVDGTYVALILSPEQETLRSVYGGYFAAA